MIRKELKKGNLIIPSLYTIRLSLVVGNHLEKKILIERFCDIFQSFLKKVLPNDEKEIFVVGSSTDPNLMSSINIKICLIFSKN